MGKHMRHKSAGIPFPHGHPGCMWRMLQVLNYQHWHWRVIKRRLTYKKHEGRKPDAVAENPGDDAQASTADDSSKRRKAEGANSKVEGKNRQSNPASKSSVKSRLKALITEEMSKRKGRGRHRRSSTCPAGSQLTGTGSDFLAEAHTDGPLPEIALNDESPRLGDENKEISSDSSSEDQVLPKSSEEPITSDENGEECGIMFSGNDSSHEQVDESEKQLIENAIFCHDLNDRKQAFLKQKSISSKELTKDGSAHQSKYFTDARDIINMNKGFLLTILQDPGSPLAHHFHKQQAISAKMGITKSGTFPSPGSSSRRGLGPRKQNHKRDGRKPPDHESTEDLCRKSMPLIAADHRADGIHQLNQANAEVPDVTSGSSSNHLKQKSDGNQVAKKRFKHLKQKIKHAIRESKKERHRIAMDAVLHKIPHKKGFSKDLTKDIVDYFKNPSRIRDVFSESSTSRRRIQHERRASSFNESMDRYTQLYESSFNREAREHISKRIQERREEEMVLPRRSAPKSLGRILSSPELHSYFYQSEDSSDAFSSDMPTTVADSTVSISSLTEQNNLDVSAALDYHSQLGTLGKSESQEYLTGIRETLSVSSDKLASNSCTNSKTIAQVGKTSDESGNLIIGDIVSQSDQDSKPEIVVPITKLEEASAIPLLNLNLDGKTVSTPAEISKSQEADLELTQSHGFHTRLDILADEEHEFKDSLKVAEGRAQFEKVETLKKDLDSDFLKDRLDTNDKDKFKYVRDLLELSGFSGNEALGTWYADDQPVDPFLYEEVKGGCIFCDPDCSRDEVGGYCNHPLLFDLINEVLLELYERSYCYCPRPLSPLCHIRPMPLGHHVLEEVWTNISWYLSFETGFDKPLDYVACKDLTRSDGWMNLQAENECLGLELEELIFDDLLDELF